MGVHVFRLIPSLLPTLARETGSMLFEVSASAISFADAS
jgi:hypothetical protein